VMIECTASKLPNSFASVSVPVCLGEVCTAALNTSQTMPVTFIMYYQRSRQYLQHSQLMNNAVVVLRMHSHMSAYEWMNTRRQQALIIVARMFGSAQNYT
jgi:hypothetical protein